jgi:hypothetical protein
MKYISWDIRIGHATSSAMTPNRIEFHSQLIKQIFAMTELPERLGLRHSAALNYDKVALAPEQIREVVKEGFAQCRVGDKNVCDVALYDFTGNAYELIRDPLLLHLAGAIGSLSSQVDCRDHIVLLPRLPGSQTASMVGYSSLSETAPNTRILLVANDGVDVFVGSVRDRLLAAPPDYSRRLSTLLESPTRSIKQKLVRRVGHFRSTVSNKCRVYSYHLENSEAEFLELLREWWTSRSLGSAGVVYHSPNNPWLPRAVKALAQQGGFPAIRSEDLTHPEIIASFQTSKPYVLVIDVVETGATLLSLVEQMSTAGLSAYDDVFAGIVKGIGTDAEVGRHRVHGVVGVPTENSSEGCPQCKLKLPITSDSEETTLRIRSYDMWHMANEANWEREPDLPEIDAFAYPLVPSFPAMLRDFGDWVSYKYAQMLKTVPHPHSFFVIHPDEPSAVALGVKLKVRFEGRLSLVKVPRDLIRKAGPGGSKWSDVLSEEPPAQEWIDQLKSVFEGRGTGTANTQPAALIIDIFNASGSTFRSLYALLQTFGVEPFGYFPMIDRDPGAACGEEYPIRKFTLYDWYGPRCLVRSAYEATH